MLTKVQHELKVGIYRPRTVRRVAISKRQGGTFHKIWEGLLDLLRED